MAPAEAIVCLFEDGTVDPSSDIAELYKESKCSPMLKRLLDNSSRALRYAIGGLSDQLDGGFPEFVSLRDLSDTYSRNEQKSTVVTLTLLTVVQMCRFLQLFERGPWLFSHGKVWPVGLCQGAIAAAAVAVCESASDILSIGPSLVCLSMRIGIEAMRRSHMVERSNDVWTVVVLDVPYAEQLEDIEEYNSSQYLSPWQRIYISARASKGNSVSGPPRVLAEYLETSAILQNTRKISTQIRAGFHAPHLPRCDIDFILGHDESWLEIALLPHAHFLSMSTGQNDQHGHFRSLLAEIVQDILNRQLDWPALKRTLLKQLTTDGNPVRLLAVGPDRKSQSLQFALTKFGVKTLDSLEWKHFKAVNDSDDDIAIIGAGGRVPGANTLDELWALLDRGKDAHTGIPSQRFHEYNGLDGTDTAIDHMATRFGCFLQHPGHFDSTMFKMSPREARQTDPAQRLLLLTTYEALEMAGYAPDSSPTFRRDRIGTFVGQTLDDYREYNACQSIDMYYVSGGIRAFGPGRLNYHFKWDGPSLSVDTACSSSAVSIQLAMQALRAGDCDMAVAGGANIMTGPNMFTGLSKANFLSPTGSCKTFDEDADGYCRGESVGVVILKRLRDAVRERDPVLGVLKAAVTNHSGNAASITHPHADTQVRLMREALQRAHVSANDIDYVETHGTGTQAGDVAELNSVMKVFNGRRGGDLVVGSVKANLGHGEAAAGINSVLKALVMMKHNCIPPHIGIRSKLNVTKPSLSSARIVINQNSQAFQSQHGGPRRLLINSFNATGGNTCLIMEEPPTLDCLDADPRGFQAVVSSACSLEALKNNLLRLRSALKKDQHTRLCDVAFTTTARRMHHQYRASFVCESIADLGERIASKLARLSHTTTTLKSQSQTIFVFGGQGSSFPGMGAHLMSSSKYFRASIMRYDSLCTSQGLPSFLPALMPSTKEKLTSVQMQLGLVAIELALVSLFRSWGIIPDMVIGHSLGEYAALSSAGVLSDVQALLLVGRRAEFLEQLGPKRSHGMISIAASPKIVLDMLATSSVQGCEISCFNAPQSCVVGGPSQELSLLTTSLNRQGITCKRLDVEYAFHTSQMDPVLDVFEDYARSFKYDSPLIPIASTLLGRMLKDQEVMGSEYFRRQMREPVQFQSAVESISAAMTASQHSVWVEVGVHAMLQMHVESALRNRDLQCQPSLHATKDSWETLFNVLGTLYVAGTDILWPRVHSEYSKTLRMVNLPHYAFDLKDYYIPYSNDSGLRKQFRQCGPSRVFDQECNSTTLHSVLSEEHDEIRSHVVFATSPLRADFHQLIMGHLVDGKALCPMSVYVDMAGSAAAYLLHYPRKTGTDFSLAISEFCVESPLVVHSQDTKAAILIEAERSSSWPGVRVLIKSHADGRSTVHCRCVVLDSIPDSHITGRRRQNFFVQSRMRVYDESPIQSSMLTFHKEAIYKIFATIVEYSEVYMLCDRIRMDSSLREGVAEVDFACHPNSRRFLLDPRKIDAIMHFAGFLLNGDPALDNDVVFIANGYDDLAIAGSFDGQGRYRVYGRMDSLENSDVFEGDIYVLLNGHIIATCTGLRFRKMKRKSLSLLLSTSKTLSLDRNALDAQVSRFDLKLARDTTRNDTIDPKPILRELHQIIADELEIALPQLRDSVYFADLGLDSLTTLSVIRTIETQMKLSVPPDVFQKYSSVAEFDAYMLQKFKVKYNHLPTTRSLSKANSVSSYPPNAVTSLSDSWSSCRASPADILRQVLADEIGVSSNEINDESRFSSLGIDSLLSLSIIDSYKRRAGIKLAPTFFEDCTTFQAASKRLERELHSDHEDSEPCDSVESDSARKENPTIVASRSMFLQGDAASSSQILFLLPDGAGSMFSYIHLPRLGEGISVCGLDSPFHANPERYSLTFSEVASVYIEEIKNIKPKGPYCVGGWSLGGVHAFEVCRQLLELGDFVEHLLLIDSPCPGVLPPLPSPTIDLLESAGVFSRLSDKSGTVSERTRKHFVGHTRAFQQWSYRPLTCKEAKAIDRVTIIWARDGAMDNEAAIDDTKSDKAQVVEQDMVVARKWLTERRSSFGPQGWDKLTLKAPSCYCLPGHHFSIMFPPLVSELGKLLKSEVFSYRLA